MLCPARRRPAGALLPGKPYRKKSIWDEIFD